MSDPVPDPPRDSIGTAQVRQSGLQFEAATQVIINVASPPPEVDTLPIGYPTARDEVLSVPVHGEGWFVQRQEASARLSGTGMTGLVGLHRRACTVDLGHSPQAARTLLTEHSRSMCDAVLHIRGAFCPGTHRP